jgi:hypothetical protein
MKAGQFRWGKTSTLVEGAAVAVALRENDRSETLIDIAVSILVFHRTYPVNLRADTSGASKRLSDVACAHVRQNQNTLVSEPSPE